MKKDKRFILVIFAAVCIIFPFTVLTSHWRLMDTLLCFLPVLIGNVLLLAQIRKYAKLLRKLLYIGSSLSIFNFIIEMWWNYNSYNKPIKSFADMSLADVLLPLVFWISYFGYKIITLVLCILLTKKQFKIV